MWKTVKLGDLVDIQNGYAFNSKQFSEDGEVPLIRIRDLKNGTSTEISYTGDYEEKYVVSSGDYLIGMDGEFRCYEWKGADALLNQRVCRLQGFSENLNARFLFYTINEKLKRIEDVTGFTTVKHLSSKTIKDIQFPLPSLAEQQRIVAKLDTAVSEIDKGIVTTTKITRNVSSLISSCISEIFSSVDIKKVPLESVSKIINGFAFKSGDFTKNKGTKCIKITNVGLNQFVETDVEYLPSKFNENYSEFSAKEGDIVFALTRTVIKGGLKVARVPQSYKGALLNQRVALVRANEDKIYSGYLYFYLCTEKVKKYVLENVNTLMQPNLSINDLKLLPVPMHNLEQQKSILEKNEKILAIAKEQILVLKKKKLNLLQLKVAILKQELQSKAA